MATISVRAAKKALTSKGFQLDTSSNSHHDFYYLFHNGVRSEIYTYFSRKTPGEDIHLNELKGMKIQLKFQTLAQLESYLNCSISEAQYRQSLIERGELEDIAPEPPLVQP